MHELPVVLILGSIALYLVLSGGLGLMRGAMRVRNPWARETSASLEGVVWAAMQRQVERDYPVPEGYLNRGEHTYVYGRALAWRAGLHIAAGLLVAGLLALYLRPDWLDALMALVEH